MNKSTHTKEAAVTEDDVTGLESSVLQGVALDDGPFVEGAIITNGHQRLLRQIDTGIIEPLADSNAEQAPDQRFERRPVERCSRHQLPNALVVPEVRLIDRAVLWLQPPEAKDQPLHQSREQDAEYHQADKC